MDKDDNNNAGDFVETPNMTLRLMLHNVGQHDMPKAKKGPMLSAIRTVGTFVGGLDTQANPRVIFEKLEALTPELAGMSKGSLANVRSRMRSAFRMFQTENRSRAGRRKLQPQWEALKPLLDEGERRQIGRFLRFGSDRDFIPADICEAHIDRFETYLHEVEMVVKWRSVVTNTIIIWNRLRETGARPDLKPLANRYRKREPYWIPVDQWPNNLTTELEGILAGLTSPKIYSGKKVRKRKPSTVKQYWSTTTTLLSAAVGQGMQLIELDSVTKLVHPRTVERALDFLAERSGGVGTATMLQMVRRAHVLAQECGIGAAEQQELKEIAASVVAHFPPDRRIGYMTPKNRELLERIENDQHFADLIYTLPEWLSEKARRTNDEPYACSLMRAAIAIELLLTCSFRRENVVELELGKSLKRAGTKDEPYWIIQHDEGDVKNGQPLRFQLSGNCAALLEEYLEHWRLRLCKVPNDWLFPDEMGQMMNPNNLGALITRCSAKRTGTAITPHQFRHISVETFLLEHPDKVDLMSAHLGHRSVNTTRNYYARSKQKQASRIYQEHGLKVRSAARDRVKSKLSRKARKPADNGSTEDYL